MTEGVASGGSRTEGCPAAKGPQASVAGMEAGGDDMALSCIALGMVVAEAGVGSPVLCLAPLALWLTLVVVSPDRMTP